MLSPAEFLGYELGTRFTPHHRVIDYVEHVATQSPNVQVRFYGETYEGRPLMTAAIASAANQERLEALRLNHLRRIGMDDGAAATMPDAPALVWLSYNVHGNEAVSTEAALAVLHQLADAPDARTRAWLDEVVVILDPCVNPDGRERYVNWYTSVAGTRPNPDPDAREHREPWPGGRTNHYYFDLNRDWAWATQKETRYRLAHYHEWMPHVHVDFHEQGVNEPYYFAPAAEPFHPRITAWQRGFQTTIGQNNARYFDAEGWLYFTREVFDLFYPGYGDTWPTFNGAIGMTYEQGGSGRAGLAVVTAEGDTLTLRDRIDHHVTTSLSTIEATVQHRDAVVQGFQRYFDEAAAGAGEAYQTYVVKQNDNPDKLRALAELLNHQGIRYSVAARERAARGRSYDGGSADFTIEPGDLLVPAAQPKGVLAQVLFEPEAELSDSLTYDITAWALPYAYGVEAYAVREAISAEASSTLARSSAITGPERPYAYLAPWQRFADAQFLAAALQHGFRPRFALQPFRSEGRSYERGTLIFARTGHTALGSDFDQRLRALAAQHQQSLHGVASGFVEEGADFGSSGVPFLAAPRVATLAGDNISAYALGEVWHFFDEQLRYPLTVLPADALDQVNLYDYDVLILPRGYYGDVLTEQVLEEVKRWVRRGGRLLALESAASFLAGQEGFLLKEKEAPEGGRTEEDHLRPFAERTRRAVTDETPGAIFRVQLDTTHPLAFGYTGPYYTLKYSTDAYAFLEQGWNVGVLRQDAWVSGFAGAGAQARLENTLAFGVQQMGRGEIIYFVDDPLFRAFWYNGRLLFSNAVFLVGQRTPGTY